MNATNINTLEDCRYNLELLFEESFNSQRDFIDYLALKKDQKYEQYHDFQNSIAI